MRPHGRRGARDGSPGDRREIRRVRPITLRAAADTGLWPQMSPRAALTDKRESRIEWASHCFYPTSFGFSVRTLEPHLCSLCVRALNAMRPTVKCPPGSRPGGHLMRTAGPESFPQRLRPRIGCPVSAASASAAPASTPAAAAPAAAAGGPPTAGVPAPTGVATVRPPGVAPVMPGRAAVPRVGAPRVTAGPPAVGAPSPASGLRRRAPAQPLLPVGVPGRLDQRDGHGRADHQKPNDDRRHRLPLLASPVAAQGRRRTSALPRRCVPRTAGCGSPSSGLLRPSHSAYVVRASCASMRRFVGALVRSSVCVLRCRCVLSAMRPAPPSVRPWHGVDTSCAGHRSLRSPEVRACSPA